MGSKASADIARLHAVADEAAALEPPVEVHAAVTEGLTGSLGRVQAAVPGRPAICE